MRDGGGISRLEWPQEATSPEHPGSRDFWPPLFWPFGVWSGACMCHPKCEDRVLQGWEGPGQLRLSTLQSCPV